MTIRRTPDETTPPASASLTGNGLVDYFLRKFPWSEARTWLSSYVMMSEFGAYFYIVTVVLRFVIWTMFKPGCSENIRTRRDIRSSTSVLKTVQNRVKEG